MSSETWRTPTVLDEALSIVLGRALRGHAHRQLAQATGLSKTNIQGLLAGEKAFLCTEVSLLADTAGVAFMDVWVAAEAPAEVLVGLDATQEQPKEEEEVTPNV